MAKKPQRSDFGRGLKGDRMYQNALAAYNRAASGKLSTTDKLFGMSEKAKAARRRAASNLDNRINKAVEGAVSKVKSDFSKFNTAANKAVTVKPQPRKGKGGAKPAYTDGQIVEKEGNKFRFNAKTKQFTLVEEPAKPKPKPKPQPAAVKPKPKPQPARQNVTPSKPKPKTVDGKTVTRVGPVSTPADKPKMNKAKIDKSMASTRKAYLKSEQEKAKQASIAEGKRRRSSRNTTVRDPRERSRRRYSR